MRALLLAALMTAPLIAWVDAASPAPACDAVREGAVACLAGRACVCRLERGGSVTGRREGHRWDCGALRPDCAPEPAGAPVADLPITEVPAGSLPAPLDAPRWRDR